jgi:uncharacterized protein (TIGR02996 family)
MQSREHRAFWAAIRKAPKDDTSRLVYADWLEENGEADRAEFIRVQCALAKLGPDRRKGRKDRVRLEPREKALLAAHGNQWLARIRAVLKGSNSWDREDRWLADLKFRRGFVFAGHFGLESARRLATAGDTVEPVDCLWVTECGALYRHKSVLRIACWRGAGCLLGFSVAWGTDQDIFAIVASAHLQNLSHLGVWHGKVTDNGMVKLAAWPSAAMLRSLDLKDNPITDAGAFALADSSYLGPLRRLDLDDTQIGPAGRKRLRERFGDALRM